MIDRIPQEPPEIKPVSSHTNRPLWSVMIPTYNCSEYLMDNIRSVLQQDPGAELMQIEVVDDCSTDTDVESLVQEIGKGRVSYYRQPENVGSLRNFETCINRATGHYIHLLHGDDQVSNGFYAEIEMLFTAFPEAGAAFTGFTFVDEQNLRLYNNNELLHEPGLLQNWLHEIARSQLIQPPAMVVKRSVYESLGSFYAVHYGEDWEMWVRIAAHYPVAHSPRNLALYRVHQNNITSRYFLSGQSMTDVLKVLDLIQNFLPPNERASAKRYTKKHLSRYFAYTSDKIYHVFGKPYIALEQSKRAVAMHFNHITFFHLLKMRIKILIGYKMKSEKKWLYRPIDFFRPHS
jgi:glycosyltransferase involved in cell wall biosynthesis